MSEYINNKEQKLKILKDKIRKINTETDTQEVKDELKTLLNEISYEDVIQVEQQLIEEGIDKDKMLELCDLHTAALRGLINPESKTQTASGHPVHTFKKENQSLKREIEMISLLTDQINNLSDESDASGLFLKLRSGLNNLMDIEKHYSRKENLLFPFLEKYNITGPSAVMWGKHDQIRELLKNTIQVLSENQHINAGDGKALIEMLVRPALRLIDEMIYKEENILFPMSLDTLSQEEWYQISQQSDEIGYCLYAPDVEWKPDDTVTRMPPQIINQSRIKLPTGVFNIDELNAVLSTLPVDITFVDKDDVVKYFSQSAERIFQRSPAILGRKVQYCHPPSSVHIVEKILNDFRSGVQSKASFWINFQNNFVYISYFALRNEKNEYLGTLEVTQNLTELRKLEGERRILEY